MRVLREAAAHQAPIQLGVEAVLQLVDLGDGYRERYITQLSLPQKNGVGGRALNAAKHSFESKKEAEADFTMRFERGW